MKCLEDLERSIQPRQEQEHEPRLYDHQHHRAGSKLAEAIRMILNCPLLDQEEISRTINAL